MKKQLCVLSVLSLVMVIGCSIFVKKEPQSIVGKWAGEHSSGAQVIMEFNDDNSMALIVPGHEEYSFKGTYTADYSKKPIVLSIRNIKSGIISPACMAIVEIREGNTLVFQGNFGSPGQISPPKEISGFDSPPSELYLELLKSE